MRNVFGWDLPPGCTDRDIEENAGAFDDYCPNCGEEIERHDRAAYCPDCKWEKSEYYPCDYCGEMDCHFDCDESQADGFEN